MTESFFYLQTREFFLFFPTYKLKCLSLLPVIQKETMCENII